MRHLITEPQDGFEAEPTQQDWEEFHRETERAERGERRVEFFDEVEVDLVRLPHDVDLGNPF